MNKLTKIGLSALAGSLVAISAHAGSLSVSGSASISFADGDTDNAGGTAAEANQWTMGDSLTFKGGGELDNGMSVAVKYEYDDDEGDLNGGGSDQPGFDSHSVTLSSAEMGSITFAGHGGATNMDNMDDKTPNAFEESWDGVSEADEETLVNGITGNNSFFYKAPSMGGATFSVAYVPQGETATPNGSYVDFGVVFKPEAVDGLEVGVAFGETEETTGTTVDEQAIYAKYTLGSISAGINMNESDTIDFTSYGISFAVTDDISVSYSASESDIAGANDQEASGVSASFTSGGMTVAGMINTVDNASFEAANDTEGYEINFSFAF
ncbi:porin [Pelagibacterales bacterium SAG-MED02]|nr:porin [Pelagibacterales bacterium SAG-MED02]